MQLQVTIGSETPVFRQIIDQIRAAVASGKVEVGDALPSVRAMASELVVNHNTVAKAYAQLVRDGVIESQQGRGYFVARKRQIYTRAECNRRLIAALDPVLSEAITLGFSPEEILATVRKRLGRFMPSAATGDR